MFSCHRDCENHYLNEKVGWSYGKFLLFGLYSYCNNCAIFLRNVHFIKKMDKYSMFHWLKMFCFLIIFIIIDLFMSTHQYENQTHKASHAIIKEAAQALTWLAWRAIKVVSKEWRYMTLTFFKFFRVDFLAGASIYITESKSLWILEVQNAMTFR